MLFESTQRARLVALGERGVPYEVGEHDGRQSPFLVDRGYGDALDDIPQ